ncbi:MAG TPA: glucosamine-6-phosphate deaminase [Spirochaetota bacterium]|nr:glucosamine-6-phosphate deaminase [Spirochaetota bacterium]
MNAPESRVESLALQSGGIELLYPPREKTGVVVVESFPALGRLAALRFLEWVQRNPGGVIALPTGKTPEYFIKWTKRFLAGWNEAATTRELEAGGVDPSIVPDMRSLHLVQIDEFYPIEPGHHNSFYHYVNNYYIDGFGLDPGKALLIDCSRIGLPAGLALEKVWPESTVDLSLRLRHAKGPVEHLQKDVLLRIDQWCHDYEERIRDMGGIGFFMGGIGPDGHIAFNMSGSDHHSTTRLTETNYETQAASATDLGGIEVAKKRLVITIGLATITANRGCVAVIMAAGEARAGVVRDAVEAGTGLLHPATALRVLPAARLYVTAGAAVRLEERSFRLFAANESPAPADVERAVIDLSLRLGKPIVDLNGSDFDGDRFCALLPSKTGTEPRDIAVSVADRLRKKIDDGARSVSGRRFLHTAPHHDDIILGYLPYAVRHIRDASNHHTFAYMTSGFTAVTNRHALAQVRILCRFLLEGRFDTLIREGYFSPGNVYGRRRDVWQYLDGVAEEQRETRDEGVARRMLRNLMEIFEDGDIENLRHRINELVNYFETQYPGKKDLPYIQKFKGMIREWESDCKWGYFGFDSGSIRHLRLGFYQGELFSEEPLEERDALPVLRVLQEVRPDVVTVAFDPEASGPDTHYKVLQAVAAALRLYEKESGRSNIEVIGYRNVWYRFHPSEADVFVPVSLNMFAVLKSAFENAFVSQADASFPSHEHEGTFAQLAQRIQVEQYRVLKTCLGRSCFHEHPSPLLRATRGFVFIKRMSLPEFYASARAIRRSAEAK